MKLSTEVGNWLPDSGSIFKKEKSCKERRHLVSRHISKKVGICSTYLSMTDLLSFQDVRF